MTDPMPRIEAVAVSGPSELRIAWRGGAVDRVDLAGWIATGGEVLAPLKGSEAFRRADVDEFGAAIVWDDGDLAIDAMHVEQIAAAQRPFGAADAQTWQKEAGLSNREAADFLRIALSTWNAYKAGTQAIPAQIAMLCLAARRDPVLMQAYYRPRKAGRPRKAA